MLSPVWLTHLRETPDTAGKAAQIWKEKKGKNPFTNDFLVLKGSYLLYCMLHQQQQL